MKRLFPVICLVSCLIAAHSFAGSATWNLNPTSGDWNTAGNWTPATVPNGPSDVASFGSSNTTTVTVPTAITVDSVVFNPGAVTFSITPSSGTILSPLTLSGAGVVNNSGFFQSFVLNSEPLGYLFFTGSASAGISVAYTMNGGDPTFGFGVNFMDNSNASAAQFLVHGGTDSAHRIGGSVQFYDSSNASSATFVLFGGYKGAYGGFAAFYDNSSAAIATLYAIEALEANATGGAVSFAGSSSADDAFIVALGSDVGGGGLIQFRDSATAGNATLIAKSGRNLGGVIQFESGADTGGTARVEVFGNGTLNVSYHVNSPLTIGSLEGDGMVTLGQNTLMVGTLPLRDTVFSGVISGTGSLVKIGSGNLTLAGVSTYSGGTTISQGLLGLDSTTGSAVGTGPVHVDAGSLGGNGIVTGEVIVGTGRGNGALLLPGNAGPGTIRVNNDLTLNSDATYLCTISANMIQASRVIANSVTIAVNAKFGINLRGNRVLSPGQSFKVISNQGATPISGTFFNLPEGATISALNNTFQVSYVGGDGNDMTLTVVQ